MRYIAQCTIGRFNVGDEVTGLTDERIAELIELGALKSHDAGDAEEDQPQKPKNQRAQKDD